MGLLAKVSGIAIASTATPALGWTWYTRNTHFVASSASDPDYCTPIAKKYNPSSNPPQIVDHAVRTVHLTDLKTMDQEELTDRFCRGIWAGPGFSFQRKYLERKYRAMEGREDQLWEKADLATSDYPVGTKLVDHFEVIERTPEKVLFRCGDSPLKQEPRESDGSFAIEVTKDDQSATFHLKSFFFDSRPDSDSGGHAPAHIEFLHREYAKLWMESSVRRLLK